METPRPESPDVPPGGPAAAPARPMFVTADGQDVRLTFLLLALLFALWGFCNGMIDVMDKHFQDELHLSLAQSAWVQFAHYLGYFLMALPAGWLANRLGYKGGIVAGLLVVAAGGFWFIPATSIASFWAFLLGVCLIASGLAVLETIANPYATVLGPPESAAARINLAQSCNGVGWLLGPVVGGIFFYSRDAAGASTGAARLWIPYAAVGVVVLALAAVFARAEVPDVRAEADDHADDDPPADSPTIWSRPHFALAVVAQFLYVGAQAGIFSFFLNYMTAQTPPVPASWAARGGPAAGWFEARADGSTGFSNQGAANLASVGLLCFLAGRLAGTTLLRRAAAHALLGLYGVVNAGLCLVVALRLGWASVAAVFLAYFFMSIMFPTIFALGISGLGRGVKRASSFLVMAIIGGSVLPKLMGEVADRSDLSRSFVVPLACFAGVAAYGFAWPRLSGQAPMRGAAAPAGH